MEADIEDGVEARRSSPSPSPLTECCCSATPAHYIFYTYVNYLYEIENYTFVYLNEGKSYIYFLKLVTLRVKLMQKKITAIFELTIFMNFYTKYKGFFH